MTINSAEDQCQFETGRLSPPSLFLTATSLLRSCHAEKACRVRGWASLVQRVQRIEREASRSGSEGDRPEAVGLGPRQRAGEPGQGTVRRGQLRQVPPDTRRSIENGSRELRLAGAFRQ